jgi:tetratricopeptide (TPR) repeat protein
VRKKNILFVLICFVFVFILSTSEIFSAPKELFTEGNKLFKEKKYSQAVGKYEELVKLGYRGMELFFNLGLSYSKIGETGKSILFLERALKYDENNEKISALLVNENLKIKDKIVQIPDFFLIKFFKEVSSFFSTWLWLFIVFIFYIALLAVIVGYLIKIEFAQRRLLTIAIPILLLFLLISIPAASISYNNAVNIKECIVLKQEVQLYSVPELSGQNEGMISEGNKLEIQDELAKWYRVQLPNGKEGWIGKEGILGIRF